MFKKRLFAYIIDVLILELILSFIGIFVPVSSNVVNLQNEIYGINDNFINGSIDVSTFINQYSNVSYNIDRYMFLPNLIGVVVSVIYFIVYPLYNNGQSFGKKVMGLRIVSDNDDFVGSNSLIFRYMLMDGIGISIISMCLIFIFSDFSYILCVSLLSFFQILVVIISIFMVLYRRDFKSLPDLVAGTKVIEVKK